MVGANGLGDAIIDCSERFEVALWVPGWDAGAGGCRFAEIFGMPPCKRLARLPVAIELQFVGILLRPEQRALGTVNTKPEVIFLAGGYLADGQDAFSTAV